MSSFVWLSPKDFKFLIPRHIFGLLLWRLKELENPVCWNWDLVVDRSQVLKFWRLFASGLFLSPSLICRATAGMWYEMLLKDWFHKPCSNTRLLIYTYSHALSTLICSPCNISCYQGSPRVLLTFLPLFTLELSSVATIIAVVVAVTSSLRFKCCQVLHDSAS